MSTRELQGSLDRPPMPNGHLDRADRAEPAPVHDPHARLRGARADPLPAGQGAGLLLRRPRPGGDLGRLVLRARPARPHVHPAPRPRCALRARRDARALPRQLHGPRRRRHRRARREHALRRPPPRLRRDGLDAARHGAGRDRARAGLQDAPRAAGRDDLLRRGLDGQRPVARGDELRRHPPPAGGLRPREQQVRVLDPELARVRGRPGRARRRLRLSRACRSTATTSRRCSRPRGSRPSAPGRATGLR